MLISLGVPPWSVFEDVGTLPPAGPRPLNLWGVPP
jgi:hypothetical protein